MARILATLLEVEVDGRNLAAAAAATADAGVRRACEENCRFRSGLSPYNGALRTSSGISTNASAR
jgi:hypothetical protein